MTATRATAVLPPAPQVPPDPPLYAATVAATQVDPAAVCSRFDAELADARHRLAGIMERRVR